MLDRLLGDISSHSPPLLLPGPSATPLLRLLKGHANILAGVLRSADYLLLIRDEILKRCPFLVVVTSSLRSTESRQSVLNLLIGDLKGFFHDSLRSAVAPASATGYAVCVEDDGNISMSLPDSSHDMVATSLYAVSLVSNVVNASLVCISISFYSFS